MARALWRGAISFGLIYLPVEVHTASRDNPLPLHLLDSRDFSPVGYQHINKRTGKEVDWRRLRVQKGGLRCCVLNVGHQPDAWAPGSSKVSVRAIPGNAASILRQRS
jgi:hypothetical protein